MDWTEYRTNKQRVAAQNRHQAGTELPRAKALMKAAGLTLKVCKAEGERGRADLQLVHVQLKSRDPDWLLNVYPGNRRIYRDENKPSPFLNIEVWTLTAVVEAFIEAFQKVRRRDRDNMERFDRKIRDKLARATTIPDGLITTEPRTRVQADGFVTTFKRRKTDDAGLQTNNRIL